MSFLTEPGWHLHVLANWFGRGEDHSQMVAKPSELYWLVMVCPSPVLETEPMAFAVNYIPSAPLHTPFLGGSELFDCPDYP